MEMRRCPYCGSQLDMEDTTCPFCGAHVGRAEAKAKGPSKPTYQSSIRTSVSSSWVDEWKKKTLIGRIITFFVFLALLFGIPMMTVGPLLLSEPTEEVCDYAYDWSTHTRNYSCHTETNPVFESALWTFIFVLMVGIICGLLLAFNVKYEHKKLGGSDVVVYRGMFKVILIIDGRLVRTGHVGTRPFVARPPTGNRCQSSCHMDRSVPSNT